MFALKSIFWTINVSRRRSGRCSLRKYMQASRIPCNAGLIYLNVWQTQTKLLIFTDYTYIYIYIYIYINLKKIPQNSYDFKTSRQIKWPRASWQRSILETLEIVIFKKKNRANRRWYINKIRQHYTSRKLKSQVWSFLKHFLSTMHATQA
jgi:hypothetical protein